MSKVLDNNEMRTSDLVNDEMKSKSAAEILNELYEKGEEALALLFEKGLTIDDIEVYFKCKSNEVGFVFRSKTKKAYDVMTELKGKSELI